jgi:hypothetical protein
MFTVSIKKQKTEYMANSEPCKVVEAKYKGRQYWFDATRMSNQYGSYANHNTRPNSNHLPPVHVSGKLRIGLVSIKQIMKEEICRDFGDRDPNFPWLSGKYMNGE